VNGLVCKDPIALNAEDLFMKANLDQPRDTKMSMVGSNITLVNVMNIPGLNTLSVSPAHIHFAPLCQNPPHTHPCANEILTVLEVTPSTLAHLTQMYLSGISLHVLVHTSDRFLGWK
jgi:hypothetical protein